MGAAMQGVASVLADPEKAKAVHALQQQVQHAHDLMGDLGITSTHGKSSAIETPAFSLLGTGVSKISLDAADVLDDVFSGDTTAEKLRNLDTVQKVGDARYNRVIDTAHEQLQRINAVHDANIIKIGKGQQLDDPGDQWRKSAAAPWEAAAVAAKRAGVAAQPAGARPIPAPQPSIPQFKTVDDLNAFKQQKHPKGTPYQVWDSDQHKFRKFLTQ
jgi:hypothetical protein